MDMNYKTLAPKLVSLGYEPLAIRPRDKAPIDAAWSTMSITEETVVKRSISASSKSGIGIRCGTGSVAVYAADFDFYNKAVTKTVAESFFELFGKGPIRIGQMPKALSVYSGLPGQAKMQTSWTAPDGVVHKFELLGAGQQFVAYGIHKDTKKAYTWLKGGLDSIETRGLPQLDFDKVTDWVNNVLPGLVPSDWILGSKSVKSKSTKSVDTFESYKAPLDGWDLQRVIDEILPNLDPSKGNDDWVKVGMAFYHQGGGNPEWLAAWDDWSSEGSNYKDGECEKRWSSFASDGRSGDEIVTLATYIKITKEAREKAATGTLVSTAKSYKEQISSAFDEEALREIAANVRADRNLDSLAKESLVEPWQTKFKALNGAKPQVKTVRDLLGVSAKKPVLAASVGIPAWAQGYVYVTQRAMIYRYDSNEWLTRESFDFKHNPDAGTDDDGTQFSAYNLLRDLQATPRVEQALYMPQLSAMFELDGVSYVNTYRPSSVPVGKPERQWTDADRKAVAVAKRHIELMCGERSDVTTYLLDWLAFNVQNPGVKISYAWLIVGGEGVGKTWFGHLMSVAMGSPNVGIVAGDEVVSGFSRWATGYAFNVVEEVRLGTKVDQAAKIWDSLKAPISNEHVVFIRKGKDGVPIPNVTNYLLLSNHDDAVPLSMETRKVGVIKTPFDSNDTAGELQSMALREGCANAEAYFKAIFSALKNHPGVIREWLATWKVSDSFTPYGRAPMTDERESLVLGNRTSEETAIRDAIDDGSNGVSKYIVCPSTLKVQLEMNASLSLTESMITVHLKTLGYKTSGIRLNWKGSMVRPWIKGVKLVKGEGSDKANKATLRRYLDDSVSKRDTTPEGPFLDQSDTIG